MCTVSWLPTALGYSLWFNRDERHTRAPALPPAPRENRGVRFLAPLDGDFHGSWLAVNELGLAVGITNRYGVPGYSPVTNPESRGRLVLQAIASTTAKEAAALIAGAALSRTQPFTLLAFEPGRPIELVAWDGRMVSRATHGAPGFVLTTSSVAEPEVAQARRAAFAAAGAPSADVLQALHQSHLPDRGRRSICMHRDDAETRSLSLVRVTDSRVTFTYWPGAPCRTTPLAPLGLERRTTIAPLPR
jgi:hypothetical protein